ncbi:MAG: SDR family NAD(P)-dependent oxidoreductase [Dehalococcoidia bacterium]
MSEGRRVAVVTGGSSGIGAATARALHGAGFEVMVGARRLERLREVAAPIGATAIALDVRDRASVDAFCARVGRCDVLVNNAGGALGLEPLAQADEAHWRTMWESNVLGLMLMTRALLPKLEASGNGHIVNIGSIAGIEVYPGGSGYTSAKHAVRAVTETLRIELLGKPVRVTEIDPGMVDTEFSTVRFGGDAERAAKVYEGLTPLRAEDIADCVTWAVTRPRHVDIDQIVVRPVAQATATQVARGVGL